MTDFGSQDVTLPLPSTSSQNNLFIGDQFGGGEAMEPTEDKTTRILKLHEKNILSEMISYFKDQTIINDKITIKRFTGGKVERGEGEGLLRDVYTEFWADFYLQCTIGCTYKVPELRHEFQEEEWEAIGRIILKGYLDVGYFPISISPTIFEECLFSKFESNILECFFLYIPLSEVNCIKQAIENFDSVDKDELIEILDSHQSHVMPTKDNLKPLIIEIANKQMVQDPHFVVDVWKRVLQPLTKKINIDKLKSLYDSAVPNTKRVLDLLKFSEPQTPGQAKTISLAKTFIRELDNEMIKVFLRYCTGSDLITEQIKETKITVDFVHMKETIRRPIARTCGCILELSDNFKSVSEFRAEFSNILKSGIFIMDIV